jgi:hypothetical protein
MKKIVKIGAITLVVLMAIIIIIPFAFKGKITTLLKDKANEQINAKLSFDDNISLSLLSSFPYFNIGMNDVCITGINEFEGDTLCAIQELQLSLDLMSVIKGNTIELRKIKLSSPRIHAIVAKGGKANWDIAKIDSSADASNTQNQAAFKMHLKLFQLDNAYIKYDDKDGNINAELVNTNYTLNGDFTSALFELNQQMDIEQLTAGMSGINYLNKVHAKADMKMDANMNDFSFQFKENHFSLNDLVFQMQGLVQLKDEAIVMDLKYEAKENAFKNFLSLIPALYANSFKDLESKGTLQFNGFAKGNYTDKTLPVFEFNLAVNEGWFKYPSLPAPVEKVKLAFQLSNPDGDLNHTKVSLNQLHFEIKNEPVDMHFVLTEPIQNPTIDLAMKAKLDLANILEIVPMKDMDLKGTIQANVEAKGQIKHLENKLYDQFNFSGNLVAQNIKVKTPTLPAVFELNNASFSFSPKTMELAAFDAKMGSSDFRLNGSIENPILYYMKKGVLNAQFNLLSARINANELMGSNTAAAETNKASDTAQLNAPEIPTDVKISFNAAIQQLDFSDMKIENFKGMLNIENGKVQLQKIAFNTIGAAMLLNGMYDGADPKHPKMDMDFGIQHLDFKQAFKHFNTVKKLVPIAEKMEGTCNANFKFNSPLSNHLQPIMAEVNAAGSLFINSAQIGQITVLDKLAEQLKNPALKEIGIKQVGIAFEVKDGKVFTKPFDLKFANKTMRMSGTTSLDQKIDYTGTMTLSKTELGFIASGADASLAALNKQLGTQLKTNELIPVALSIGGTFTSPTVKSNLTEVLANQTNSLKDQAKAELEKKKAELEAKVKAELEKQKNAAKAELDKLKKEAENKVKAETARLKAEADAKAKAEADKLKKKAEEEALKRLKGLF